MMDLLSSTPRELLEVILEYIEYDDLVNILDLKFIDILNDHAYWNKRILNLYHDFKINDETIHVKLKIPDIITLCQPRKSWDDYLYIFRDFEWDWENLTDGCHFDDYFFKDLSNVNIFPESAIDIDGNKLSTQLKEEILNYIKDNLNIDSVYPPYLGINFEEHSNIKIYNNSYGGGLIYEYHLSFQDLFEITFKLKYRY
jgi:hypothetical protein